MTNDHPDLDTPDRGQRWRVRRAAVRPRHPRPPVRARDHRALQGVRHDAGEEGEITK